MNTVKIGSHLLGEQHPPFIVAELSGNHQQSLEKALQLVEAAKNAGAHAIKLQTYTPDTITLDSQDPAFFIKNEKSLWKGRRLYELYQEAHLPWEWHKPIFEKCRALNLTVFSSPFDETAIDFLETLDVPCYKIASPEIVDLALIKKAAQTKKPLIISTAASSLVEIGEAVQTAKEAGCVDLILLKCTAAYPAEPKEANIRTIPHLSHCFNTLVGLSDHTLGIGVAIAAISQGACLIEKHLTLSRAEGGVDSAFSMEPDEFKSLVIESRRAWESLGQINYTVLESEKVTHSHRPSLYFTQDIPAGKTIMPFHLTTVRPGAGLPPKELKSIIGLTLISPVKKATPVNWKVFKRDA